MYVCKKCQGEIERNIPASEVGGSYTDFDMKDNTKYCACWRCQTIVKEEHIDKIGRHVNYKMRLSAKMSLVIVLLWALSVSVIVRAM